MDVVILDYTLILWTILWLAYLVVSTWAIYKLVSHPADPRFKFLLVLSILFLPFIGALTFFALIRQKK